MTIYQVGVIKSGKESHFWYGTKREALKVKEDHEACGFLSKVTAVVTQKDSIINYLNWLTAEAEGRA